MSKLNSRYIHATFCDDVRNELGGKLSLMGIYQSAMHINSASLPVVLPKICVVIEARAPSNAPFKQLHLRIFLDDKLLVEGGFSPDQLKPSTNSDMITYTTHGLIVAIQPFSVETEGFLRVRAETEDGEIKVGSLKLILNSNDSAETLSP